MKIPELNFLTVLSGTIDSNICEIECDFDEYYPNCNKILPSGYYIRQKLFANQFEPIDERVRHINATSNDFKENIKLYFESLQGSFILDYDKKKVCYKRNGVIAPLGYYSSEYIFIEKLFCVIYNLLNHPKSNLFIPVIESGLTEEAQALLTQLMCKSSNVYKDAGYKIIVSTHSNIVINNIVISVMRDYIKREYIGIQFLKDDNEWVSIIITDYDRIDTEHHKFFTQNSNDLAEILGF